MQDDPSAARHAATASSTGGQLARRWLLTLRWHLLLLFLSDFGRDVIYHKYDAFTTDRAYHRRSSGRLGVGKLVDWLVQRQALHAGLRQRLQIVVSELVRAAGVQEEQGNAPVRIVSGPCGLARDITLAAGAIGDSSRVEFWGVDLDFSGEVLSEAKRRTEEAGLELHTQKQDLHSPDALSQSFEGRPVHISNSIGLTPWLNLDEIVSLFETVYRVLVPGGGGRS